MDGTRNVPIVGSHVEKTSVLGLDADVALGVPDKEQNVPETEEMVPVEDGPCTSKKRSRENRENLNKR